MPVKPTSAYTRSQLSDATGNLKIPPNSQRVAIILSESSAGGCFVQFGAADGSAVGVFLASTASPLVLTEAAIGTAVQADIKLIDSAGAQRTFAYIEVLTCVYARDDERPPSKTSYKRDL